MMQSSCCGAETQKAKRGISDGTWMEMCTKCFKPCDVVSEAAEELADQFSTVSSKLQSEAYDREERLAWDRYAAAAIGSRLMQLTHEYEKVAHVADELLDKRRKRFPRPD